MVRVPEHKSLELMYPRLDICNRCGGRGVKTTPCGANRPVVVDQGNVPTSYERGGPSSTEQGPGPNGGVEVSR